MSVAVGIFFGIFAMIIMGLTTPWTTHPIVGCNSSPKIVESQSRFSISVPLCATSESTNDAVPVGGAIGFAVGGGVTFLLMRRNDTDH